MDIQFISEFEAVKFNSAENKMVGCTNEELARYYKGLYTNKERFLSRRWDSVKSQIEGILDISEDDLKEAERVLFYNNTKAFLADVEDLFDKVEPFSFKEAFSIEQREFQALVFSSINISEMISSLGATRIKTDGINVKHRKYDKEGNFLGLEDYYNVYEIHEVSGEKLGVEGSLYVVKCWCTSTNKEHWLWIDEKYKDDPLTAIASTFMVHENVIPHITALKRQGDLLLVETDQDVKPEGELVSLTKDQYFGLLVAQS